LSGEGEERGKGRGERELREKGSIIPNQFQNNWKWRLGISEEESRMRQQVTLHKVTRGMVRIFPSMARQIGKQSGDSTVEACSPQARVTGQRKWGRRNIKRKNRLRNKKKICG